MSDEELKKKRRIRGGHKGYVTTTLEKVQALLNEFEPTLANQLKTYRIALTEKLNILGALDDEILALMKEEHIEDEIKETGTFRESIHQMIVEIDETLHALELEKAGHSDKSISHSNSNSFTESLGAGKAKLPKITLKKFYGDPISFSPFWDSFASAVDDNCSLSDVDKFNYLRSLLEGPAAGAIRGLPLTAENYEAAKSILKKRFGQPQIIINAHMEGLVKLAAVTVDNDLKRLRFLYDRIEAHVRALQALGIDSGSYGKLLIPLLMEKLPSSMRLIISRTVDDPQWDLDVLLKAFDHEIEARERCEPIGTNPTDSPTPKKPLSVPTSKGKEVSSASALTNQSEGSVTCTFCRQRHPSASCSIVTDIEARRNLLKRQGRCFVCLRRSHIARDCSPNKTCRICSGRHHMSICERASCDRVTSENTSQRNNVVWANEADRRESKSSTTVYVDSNTSILLQTAIASVSRIHQQHPVVKMRILFDSGSQRSYISERAKRKLGLLSKRKEKLLIKTFGQENEELRECDVVELCVRGLSECSGVQMTALSVPLICSPLKEQAVQFAQQSFSHLEDLKLADQPSESCGSEVDVLIGNDFYWSFFTGETKRGELGPVAMKTSLGWVLSGSMPYTSGADAGVNMVTTHTLKLETSVRDDLGTDKKGDDPLLEQVKNFWELEAIGVSTQERSVHEKFLDTIHLHNGRYEVSLPWKEQHALLPDNYALAVTRLASVLKRLRRNPELFEEYNRIIEEQSSQGIISAVDSDAPVEVGRLHYLPHHPVVREDKQTTKVRIVYDASAKSTGPSLNDCLHAGPSLLCDIPDVLMRFRYHRVALAADIEKAFLMVQVAEDDRDVLRFLWIDDPNDEHPRIIVKRFNRVVFGVTSSPFLLNGTIRHHVANYEEEDPQFVNDFLTSLYVDDFSGGKDSAPEAFELYKKARLRMNEAGFNLRKWISSSEKLMHWIEQEEGVPAKSTSESELCEEDGTYAQTHLGAEGGAVSSEKKILGLNWDIERDSFIFRFDWLVQFAKELPLSKRSVLRVVAKLYDPLGLVSPLFVTIKALFQDLCKLKIDWDDPFNEELTVRYSNWLSDLSKVDYIPVKRCYLPEEDVISLQIHGFGDGSEVAYAAAVYLRMETSQGVYAQLLMSKSRVVPLARQTIPRIELLASLILSRLVNRVRTALIPVVKVDEIFCWTDSTTTLHWIKGVGKEFKQFVENRVTEIRQNVSPESWNHCPGLQNPADLPSRGMGGDALKQSEIWWHGPSWLVKERSTWPNFGSSHEPSSAYFEEMRLKGKPKSSTGLIVSASMTSLTRIFDPEKYGEFKKLIRVTALVLRAVHNFKSGAHGETLAGPLSTEEYAYAENLWLREMQQSVIKSQRFKELEQQLGLYRDDNELLRCKGRLQNATIPFNAKYPIFLPSDHYLTVLIIQDCHKRVLHNGVRETLVELRSRFWIVKGRQIVRKVLSRCVDCKRIEGQHYAIPPTAPLPQFRVEENPAFTNTGIDFAGPLFVKRDSSKEQSGMEKVYIALYTCGSSRAVHIDVVPDLSAEAFIRSFKRFICRRGIPRLVVSDNAKTFKSAAKLLLSLFELPEVQSLLLNHKIKWRFNLELAPWWGGFFERMIRCVKRCLKKILKNAKLTYDELSTVVVEVECVLNSRPLTYVSSDDTEEPLTPSHLLTGRRVLSIPDEFAAAEEDATDRKLLTRRQRYLSAMLSHFWNRWKREYVVELREHHRSTIGSANSSPSVAPDDVVTVMEEGKSNRGAWTLGRIVTVHPGSDGFVRGATVEVASSTGKRRRLRRPLQKLFPLEVREVGVAEREETAEPGTRTSQRQRRNAAIAGEDRRRAVDQFLHELDDSF